MEGTIDSTPTTSSEPSGASAAVSERPTSASQALTQAAASLSSEAAASPETSATGTAPAPDQTGALHPSTEGPIPFPVHKTALENARIKAVEEWRQQHGWAEQVDRASVLEAERLGSLYRQDRAGYVRQLLTEAAQDPTLAPVVRSEAARILGARHAQPVDLSPDVPVLDEHGNVVTQTLSADRIQARIDAAVAKALGTFGETVKPLLTEREQRQAEAQAAEQARQLEVDVSDLYAEAIDVLPHFKEHEVAIAQVMDTIPGDPAKAMRQAWKQVVGPLLSAKAKADVLDSFNKKVAAQTVDGSGKAASTPARPQNQQELARYMRQLAGS